VLDPISSMANQLQSIGSSEGLRVPRRRTKIAPAVARQEPKAKRQVRVRPVPAVSRAIAILRFLGRQESALGVKAIADELKMVPSTCLHILRVLVEEELVRIDPATKRYSPGSGMLGLARNVLEHLSFPNAVQPVLNDLASQWGVTTIGVEVTRLDHMTVLALSRSQTPFRLQVDVGSRFPALVSATGRLVAAFSDRPWPEIEAKFRQLRWNKPPNIIAWRKEVEQARERGYSIDQGNYMPGIVVVASPIFDNRNRLTYVLVSVGLAEQIRSSTCNELAKALMDRAQALTRTLHLRN
jgi:DNA-binding IclR family transcriptional regulator